MYLKNSYCQFLYFFEYGCDSCVVQVHSQIFFQAVSNQLSLIKINTSSIRPILNTIMYYLECLMFVYKRPGWLLIREVEKEIPSYLITDNYELVWIIHNSILLVNLKKKKKFSPKSSPITMHFTHLNLYTKLLFESLCINHITSTIEV